MDDLPLSGLQPDDPENFLSPEARRRIRRAYGESDQLIDEAEERIRTSDIDPFGDKARRMRNEASFSKAQLILNVISEEFCRVTPCLHIYQRWMRDLVESASNSLDLREHQETELQAIFAYPPSGISPPSVDPLGKLLKVSHARYRNGVRNLIAKRDARYRQIEARGCKARGGERQELMVFFHKEIVRKRVEAYKEIADESQSKEMLSPIRLHELRAAIKDEIRHAYLLVKDAIREDCRKTGEGLDDDFKALDYQSIKQEAQIFSVADSLLRVIEANQVSLESNAVSGEHLTRATPQPGAPKLQPAETIAQQIEALRLLAGITQEKLAELLKITTRQVQRHIAGDATPNGLTLTAYNRIFKQLLGEKVVIEKKS